MISKKLAVIQFPGSNCEEETVLAAEHVGFCVDIVSWNSQIILDDYDAYIIPGGFSYQDRVRAGAIASRLKIMESLRFNIQKGKPVLGICNGCQILAEFGVVPHETKDGNLLIGLSKNRRNKALFGFICDWVYVKIKNPEKNVFTRYLEETVLPVPINHAEGAFFFRLDMDVDLSKYAYMQYSSKDGYVSESSTMNVNGSVNALAGLGNDLGNVFIMMPHPERAYWLRQYPFYLDDYGEKKRESFKKRVTECGPWQRLFLSAFDYVLESSHKWR